MADCPALSETLAKSLTRGGPAFRPPSAAEDHKFPPSYERPAHGAKEGKMQNNKQYVTYSMSLWVLLQGVMHVFLHRYLHHVKDLYRL